jgi:hypothetical protein
MDYITSNDLLNCENSDNIICAICKNVITETVTLLNSENDSVCTHIFCKECINDDPNYKCAVCKKNYSLYSTVSFYDKIIKNQKVICKNKDCKEILTIGNVIDHLDKVCLYENINCETCNDYYYRKDYDEHYYKCDLCNLQVCKTSSEDHKLNLCSKRIVKCSSCNDEFTADMQITHKDSCKELEVFCKFNHVGCKVSKKRKFIDDHYNEDISNHMNLLNEKIIRITKKGKSYHIGEYIGILDEYGNIEPCVILLIIPNISIKVRYIQSQINKEKTINLITSKHLIKNVKSQSYICKHCNLLQPFAHILEFSVLTARNSLTNFLNRRNLFNGSSIFTDSDSD